MSKARTLADFISDGSEFADGTISVAEVSGAAPLASPSFTGEVNTAGDIKFADSANALFGSGADLRITHDSQNSYIRDTSTGNLIIEASSELILRDYNTAENFLKGTGNGSVQLYYDGAEKISTQSDGAAITGKTTTDELDLNALAATISDTAVDIFVYDTRKDSDGGAWRKRTQHTSWYNETLNTATRGSRKEFPAVAVIVAETSKVTIYDGDDPDLPMWMVFNRQSQDSPIAAYNLWWGAAGSNPYPNAVSCSALNGQIFIAMHDANNAYASYNGVRSVELIKDICVKHVTAGNSGFVSVNDRNTYMYPIASSSLVKSLVNGNTNDVAMTVLPNAPIDAATGLPVPTIAVATDGGVSVIKDDGTVVSDSTIDGITPYVGSVAFWNNETLAVQYGYASTDDFTRIRTFSYPAMTEQYQYRASQDYSGFMGAATNWTESLTNKAAIGSEYGLIALHRADDPSEVTAANQMVAQVASDYNTGWMNGDIKLATLSDTDDTDVTGSELVTNGTFDTDTSGWTAGTQGNGTTLSLSGNELVIVSDSSTYGEARQSITLEANTTYVFTVYIAYSSQIYYTRYRLEGTDFYQTLLTDGSVTSLGWQTVTFTTGSTVPNDIELILSARNDVVNQRVDNISIRKAEEDRSVNGNGLQVIGSITKDPVATGADLVAYSGFDNDSYLQQPVNTDLHFGSSDYCFMGWVKNSSSTQTQAPWELSMGSDGTGDPSILCYLSGGDVTFYTRSTSSNWVSLSTPFSTDVWHQIVMVYRNGIKHLYLDGELKGTQAHSGTFSSSDSFFTVGYRGDGAGNPCFFCDISLVRISATAPSPEQIKKIYEDEKVLFQENAQATLYGSSDAVTALAYDDSTNLLHVGTSAGRSVFQGLRRVDNTTTAVGAAISASNGLVADE